MKGGNVFKNFQKIINDSLGFLDITWVRILIFVIIILYIVGAIPLLTADVASIFHSPLVKMLIIIFILYVGFKDIPLALLLALAFVLSIQIGYRYQLGAQIGASPTGITAGAKAGISEGDDGHGANIDVKAKLGENSIEGMIGDNGDDKPEGFNYNNYSDCVKDCAENDLGQGSLSSPCKGVGVWKEELNAQGLNCPLGFSGLKDGAPF